MKKIKYLVVLAVALVALQGCNSERKDREKALERKYTELTASGTASSENVKELQQEINEFLQKYPRAKKSDQFSGYLTKLSQLYGQKWSEEIDIKYSDFIKAEYHSIDDAIEQSRAFLQKFEAPEVAKVIETRQDINEYYKSVKEVVDMFERMKSEVFSKDYQNSTIESLNSKIVSNYLFQNSDYQTIKASWRAICATERSLQAEADLNRLAGTFQERMKEYAVEVASETYSDKGLSSFRVNQALPIKEESFSGAKPSEGIHGYEAEGVYTVPMKGSILGIDKGTVTIRLQGKCWIRFNDQREPYGVMLDIDDYSIEQTSGM